MHPESWHQKQSTADSPDLESPPTRVLCLHCRLGCCRADYLLNCVSIRRATALYYLFGCSNENDRERLSFFRLFVVGALVFHAHNFQVNKGLWFQNLTLHGNRISLTEGELMGLCCNFYIYHSFCRHFEIN